MILLFAVVMYFFLQLTIQLTSMDVDDNGVTVTVGEPGATAKRREMEIEPDIKVKINYIAMPQCCCIHDYAVLPFPECSY